MFILPVTMEVIRVDNVHSVPIIGIGMNTLLSVWNLLPDACKVILMTYMSVHVPSPDLKNPSLLLDALRKHFVPVLGMAETQTTLKKRVEEGDKGLML